MYQNWEARRELVDICHCLIVCWHRCALVIPAVGNGKARKINMDMARLRIMVKSSARTDLCSSW